MSVYIPASVRGPIYAAFALIGVALGAIQIGFATADAGTPTWLKVALAVYSFVGGAIGYAAATNTPNAPTEAALKAITKRPENLISVEAMSPSVKSGSDVVDAIARQMRRDKALSTKDESTQPPTAEFDGMGAPISNPEAGA